MRMKGDTDCIIRHLGHHTSKTFRSLQAATGWSRFPADAIVNGLKTKTAQVLPEFSPTPPTLKPHRIQECVTHVQPSTTWLDGEF